ncbi:MAG: STN domain-containing protein [Thermoguttaceae bacterium]
MDIVWSEIPLRQALESLARNKKVAVLIDRRVDPSRKIDISLHQTPLKEVLETIAQKCNLGISMVGPAAYFAPPEVARRVRTLVALRQEDVRRLAPAAAKRFFNQKSMAWDDFAQPRELLEKLGTENGIRIEALDQIPHDLWAAADLPPLELIERITLIAGQYDLTFQVSADGNRLTLLPVPEHVELVRTYPAGRQAQATAKNYAALAPQAQIQIKGDKIVVVGMIEDHQRISAPHRPAERNTAKSADTDFTLKQYTLTIVEQPIGPLLEQLGPQLNLELKIDDNAIRQAGVSLDQRVSFSVKDATVDELLRAALQQTGLKFVRRGNVVQIEPSQVK